MTDDEPSSAAALPISDNLAEVRFIAGISVIVPNYREEANIPLLRERMIQGLQ